LNEHRYFVQLTSFVMISASYYTSVLNS